MNILLQIVEIILLGLLLIMIFFKKGINDSLSGGIGALADFKKYKNQDKLVQKRDVYIELVNSMRIFIKDDGFNAHESRDNQRKFLKAYDQSWLWSSDRVQHSLSEYMQFKITYNEQIEKLSDEEKNQKKLEEQKLFAKCVLEMRKDIGFQDTDLTVEDYKFIKF
ncbi:hypothetical protein [Sporolactobacillus laevolacticus]|uniref:Uncharacterized protein n=1 Tax=Sporolactobacillus laevolacticus DSM 442 TaxID=1395513 RepID=V6IZG1_9BACL|nr:hypothetical protein [Sporolactobacillus laevolacticus]EST12196.1 hypothetical protein P343_07725 [Sporolactobacillus laevolacticus DSM 442]